jgi:hypothetical protein
VEAHLGLGAPLGVLGVAADYSLLPAVSMGAGLGVGSGLDGPSPHAALLAHLRPVYGVRNALVVDAGYSFGGYRRFQLDLAGHGPSTRYRAGADLAHWLQIGMGWERGATRSVWR